MQAVRRILNAQPLYVAPSLDYVPTLYTPLYFYVAALVARAVGPSPSACAWSPCLRRSARPR